MRILIFGLLYILILFCSCEESSPQLSEPRSKPIELISDSPIARNFALVIDSDTSSAPTPINTAYLNVISLTRDGDEILSYQKYFKNKLINDALIAAAARKVKVKGIYRDELEPSCSLLPQETKNLCNEIFVRSSLPHHKNMMILHQDYTVNAIIGSYNLRESTIAQPRIHTVLTFDILDGRSVFEYYRGEADKLLNLQTEQPQRISIDVEGGGKLYLQMHPANENPVLDMLNSITSFESTLWVSFYSCSNDKIGIPVYDRLQALHDAGCDVRVLLFDSNLDTKNALETRGVPVQFPTYSVDNALLGHKLLMVRSGGNLHLIQSSANLSESHYNSNHNLTLYLQAPGLNEIQTQLEFELNRYWR